MDTHGLSRTFTDFHGLSRTIQDIQDIQDIQSIHVLERRYRGYADTYGGHFTDIEENGKARGNIYGYAVGRGLRPSSETTN